jgi:hypothetical protein
MDRASVFLFDVDGVVVDPLAYRICVREAISQLCEQAGIRNGKDLVPTASEIAYYESRGMHDVWDITNIMFAAVLVEAVRKGASLDCGAQEGLRRLKELSLTLVRPDYAKIADALDQRTIGAAHPPDIALERFAEELARIGKNGSLQCLEGFLKGTRDVYQSYGTRIFQNLLLGKEFAATYGLPSAFDGESLLEREDRLLITQQTVEKLRAWPDGKTTYVGIYTGRPSNPPKRWTAEEKGYSPEAEIVLASADMSAFPLIAMGMMEWLARREGVRTEDVTKPSMTQGIAATICACNGGDDVRALDEAYAVDKRGADPDTTGLRALKGRDVDLFVFEDTTAGIAPLVRMSAFLAPKGYSIKVRALGIARDASKREALARVCEQVFADVNEAAAYAMRMRQET